MIDNADTDEVANEVQHDGHGERVDCDEALPVVLLPIPDAAHTHTTANTTASMTRNEAGPPPPPPALTNVADTNMMGEDDDTSLHARVLSVCRHRWLSGGVAEGDRGTGAHCQDVLVGEGEEKGSFFLSDM